MSLNPNFMIAPSLQEFFIDKQTGLPMVGGLVYFYSDVNRSTLKPIYQLSGSYPTYSYTPLPNPVTLSGVGTFTDANGNDVLPYYYPFDSNGNPELYYIVVIDAQGNQQFTRQAYPNFVQGGGNTTISTIVNYIPNGQFLTHETPPQNPSSAFVANTVLGQIPATQPVTAIAQGGWTFERPNPSTATDIVTFVSIQPTDIPNANPRFAVNIQNTVPGTDAFKYVGMKFRDVNKFSTPSTALPTQFTLGFSAKTNNGTSQNVQIYVKKFFGAGGSASTTQAVGSIQVIQSSYNPYWVPINFGNNNGLVVGSGGDDYVEIIFGLPSSVNMQITDVFLTPGNVTNVNFPVQTNADMLSKSVAGWIPTPDPTGLDNYLPLVLTPVGAKFDRSIVGQILTTSNNAATPSAGWVQANGAQYYTFGYDQTVDSITGLPTNIPYSRLQNIYFQTGVAGGVPLFGTGASYSTAANGAYYALTTSLFITSNTAGQFTAAANGGVSPGITWTNSKGLAATPKFEAYYNGGTVVYIVASESGAVIDNIVDGGTPTGWSFNQLRGAAGTTLNGYSVSAVVVTTNSIAANSYFTFSTQSTKYYMYFGADPSLAGRTGIQCTLPASSIGAGPIAAAISQVLNGFTQDIGVIPAGNAIPNSSYFTFNNTTGKYYVWFNKNGTGTDPAPVGTILGIQIPYTGAESAAQMVQKIVYQTSGGINYGINVQYFAVPDVRGKFIRYHDGSAGFDIDAAVRLGNLLPYFSGDVLGSLEIDDFIYHTHSATTSMNATGANAAHTQFGTVQSGAGAAALVSPTGATPGTIDPFTAPTGAFTTTVGINTNVITADENRPINIQMGGWVHL